MSDSRSASPFVSIIVPNWNGSKHIGGLLDSLSRLNYPKEAMEVIIVDNASEDDSKEVINQKFQKMKDEGWSSLKLIENERNVGAPAAYNQAIAQATHDCDYYLKLDNDVVLEPDCLRILVDVAEANPKCGAVGPKVYFYGSDRILNYAGGSFQWWPFKQIIVGFNEKDEGQYDRLSEQDFLHGCTTLLRKKAIEKVGAFDEAFFLYHDDVELNLRMKKYGYSILFVPDALVFHRRKSELTEEEHLNRTKIAIRNMSIMISRHATFTQKICYHLSMMVYSVFRILKFFLLKDRSGIIFLKHVAASYSYLCKEEIRNKIIKNRQRHH